MSMHVGCREADAVDPKDEVRVPSTLLYPSVEKGHAMRLGRYVVEAKPGAHPEGDAMPLVAISHGTGGTPWVYRDLATHLAREGFVVAMVEHPGNNRDDDRLAGTFENLEQRPRHLRMAIDAAFADPVVGPRLSPTVGVIGHSMGGYTALALAGGRPSSLPRESRDGESHDVPVARDDRVGALVLLAPATGWFVREGALAEVDLPIFLRFAEKDEYLTPRHAEIVKAGVRDPRRVHEAVVLGAGHFAFLTPFPREMVRPDFAPCKDPEGFDRTAFLPDFYADVTRFLRGALTFKSS